MDRTQRKRLGEILVAEGMLAPTELQRALAEQKAGGRRERLGDTIVRLGLCTEKGIAEALAKQLGLETVDFNDVEPSPAALDLVPRNLADRHHALPLRIEPGDVLVVAIPDPTNILALDDLKLMARMRAVRPVVATPTAITAALRRAYATDTDAVEAVESFETDPESSLAALADQVADVSRGGDDQPIIRLTNAILADAVRSRTSDIHIEPMSDSVRVRYRIDGILKEVMRIPKKAGPSLLSRLKIMSKLDIAERRRPQDGRAMIKVDGHEVDLRVSSMPSLHGEVIVMRLLRKGAERLTIDDLGMMPDHHALFMDNLARPQGLILITGPTGSGKTTTLYAGLATITDEVRNIITLEDPIEYELDGVNQSQMAPKIGFTFAAGLRSVLRQDPDVVMVGEIRDLETAELAMEASFTGHLVLSTLHTNDAIATVMRLVDLGVDRFLISSSLLVVAAQRLARRVCADCAEPDTAGDKELADLGLERADLHRLGAMLQRGVGCNTCDRTGYSGRVGVLETLSVTPEVRDMILRGANEPEIRAVAARQGMRSLRADGIAKAMVGLTTLDEVVRITPDDAISTEEAGRRDLAPIKGLLDLLRPEGGDRDGDTGTDRHGVAVPVVGIDDIDPDAVVEAGRSPLDGLATRRPATTTPPQPTAPARAPADDARHTPTRPPHAAAATHPVPAADTSPGGTTVLVVSPDDTLGRLVADTFRDGHVLPVASAAEARAALGTLVWDAIVVDHDLPDVTGLDLVAWLRRDGGVRDAGIVLVTDAADSSVEIEGMIAGADDFLPRPLDGAVLRARIATTMRRRSRA